MSGVRQAGCVFSSRAGDWSEIFPVGHGGVQSGPLAARRVHEIETRNGSFFALEMLPLTGRGSLPATLKPNHYTRIYL